MRILPIRQANNISNPYFKGYSVEGGTYNWYHMDAAKHTGRRIEETVGVFHPNQTGVIYYADPLEKVTDKIKERVDIVVYDDEPALPNMDEEVSKIYFFQPNKDAQHKFLDQLTKFREYFYRLEMMDRKTVGEYEKKLWNNENIEDSKAKADYFKAHVTDAQYNQETATIGEGIFNDSKGLIDYKDRLYSEMQNLEYHINKRNADIPKAEHELKQREQLETVLKTKVTNLETQQTQYESMLETFNKANISNQVGAEFTEEALIYNDRNHTDYRCYENYTDFLAKPISVEAYQKANEQFVNDTIDEKQEQNHITAQLDKVKKSLAQYKEDLRLNGVFIQKIGQYKNELPIIIENLTKELAEKTNLFEKAKADLIPHFEKLKNHFISRGVRVIR